MPWGAFGPKMSSMGSWLGRRKPLRHITVAVASALLAVFACELGLRVYLFRFADPERLTKYARFDDLPPHAYVFRGHPYTNYRLNESYRSRDGRSRHNALGFRGHEVHVPKPEGIYRIVCIGGSTTYTEVPDDSLTYPAQLEKSLRERHGQERVEVVNAGVNGWSSWECLIDLEFRILDLDPDLLVVCHGINDVYPRFVPPEAYRGDNTGRVRQWQPGTAWWERSVLLRVIGVKLGYSRGNTVLELVNVPYPDMDLENCLDVNPPVYFARNLESTVALARHFGVDVMLATFAWCTEIPDYVSWPVYQRALHEGNDVIRRVAERNDVPLFELSSAMNSDPALWADSRHVNAAGAKVMADLFADFIRERFLMR